MSEWLDWHESDIERQERWQQLDDAEARERDRADRLYERGGDQYQQRVDRLMQCNGLDRDEAELVAAVTKTCGRCRRTFVNGNAHFESDCDAAEAA